MIIDADVHISPLKEGNRISYEELLVRMDRSQVDYAISWLQPSYFRDIQTGNAYVAEAMSRHPERILGFGWVDPHYGEEYCLKEIERCIRQYHFFGIKLNGAQNEFRIDDPVLSWPLISAIANSGKILAFHIGADAIENTHPFRLVKIAKAYPKTTILAVHMGGASQPDLSSSMIEVAQEYSNIYLVGSSINPQAILRAIHILGAHRILFGSDTPFGWMHIEIAKYKALLEDLSSEDKKLVLGENMKRLLDLKG